MIKQSMLEKHFLDNQSDIESWMQKKWEEVAPPIYGSIDLRNSEFKLAPVDMNLFPAGFNNINSDFIPLCINAIRDTVEECHPDTARILLIPENHTRNINYLENVAFLKELIEKAGFKVEIGSLIKDLNTTDDITLPSGRKLQLKLIKRADNKIFVDEDFVPCLIWLNNDLSNEIPKILQEIDQVVRPPLKLGWHNRLKSKHFGYYKNIAEEFSEVISIDPWLIDPLFSKCHEVDFMKRDGIECLMENTDSLLSKIRKKYTEYKVSEKPFLIIKSDTGTYGMSVMPIFDAKQLSILNRKQRTHMSSSKGGNKVSKVILQEGVYTFEILGKDNAIAEPVIYMIGKHVVGGFYRVHKNRGVTENLNVPGMYFEPLKYDDLDRFYIYGVIGRLSMLAAANEKEAIIGELL